MNVQIKPNKLYYIDDIINTKRMPFVLETFYYGGEDAGNCQRMFCKTSGCLIHSLDQELKRLKSDCYYEIESHSEIFSETDVQHNFEVVLNNDRDYSYVTLYGLNTDAEWDKCVEIINKYL